MTTRKEALIAMIQDMNKEEVYFLIKHLVKNNLVVVDNNKDLSWIYMPPKAAKKLLDNTVTFE